MATSQRHVLDWLEFGAMRAQAGACVREERQNAVGNLLREEAPSIKGAVISERGVLSTYDAEDLVDRRQGHGTSRSHWLLHVRPTRYVRRKPVEVDSIRLIDMVWCIQVHYN